MTEKDMAKVFQLLKDILYTVEDMHHELSNFAAHAEVGLEVDDTVFFGSKRHRWRIERTVIKIAKLLKGVEE